MAVFPGNQGGPLMHIIAAKAVAFGECLTDEFFRYALQVQKKMQNHGRSICKKRLQYYIWWYRQPYDVDRFKK